MDVVEAEKQNRIGWRIEMIKETVNKLGRHLEILTQKNIPVETSLDMLGRQAKTVEELVVVEVMREVISELHGDILHQKAS